MTTMLSAEVQRVLLIVGLAATGYLLVLQWNEDYGPKGAVPRISEAPSVEPAPGLDVVPQPATPAEPAPTDTSDDVPDASLVGEVEAPAPPRHEAESAERLVRVTTNALDLWIDRLGGDIVRAQLPRYPMSLETPDVPFVILDSGGGHTYVAQSGLVGPDGVDSSGQRPLYKVEANEYHFTNAPGMVRLAATVDDVTVHKTFELTPDEYVIGMRYEVDNGRNTPIDTALFAQLKRDDHEAYGEKSFTLGPQPYLGAALTTNEERYQKLSFGDLDDEAFREPVTGGWIAILQHYFLSAWVANPENGNRYYGHRRDDGTYVVGYTAPLERVEPGATGTFSARFYAGPKDQDTLEKIAPNLNLTVDYGFLWWLAVPLFHLLKWLQSLVGNWGVAIILLTLVVKLALYPLSAASYKSMANMRRVAPQLKRLQERHSDDRQKLSQEMMALYQKEKINPLGGCLPILLQMPVFIALYWVLFESVELRHAPFFLWIVDLAAMDRFFVLPILMGATMYVQQLLNPPIPDPVQARVMKFMPIMFTVLFLFFPAGLVLYWLVNNVLSIAQQWFITRQIEKAGT